MNGTNDENFIINLQLSYTNHSGNTRGRTKLFFLNRGRAVKTQEIDLSRKSNQSGSISNIQLIIRVTLIIIGIMTIPSNKVA